MRHLRHWLETKHIIPVLAVLVFGMALYAGALQGWQTDEDLLTEIDSDFDPAPEEESDLDTVPELLDDAQQDISGVFRGLLYTASDYEELKETLERSYNRSVYDVMRNGYDIEEDVDYAAEGAETESVASSAADKDGGTGDYSSTNLREANVDEGDIVKTDGRYIYSVTDSDTVRIVSADGGKLSLAAEFLPDFGGDDSALRDLYIKDDTMVLVGDSYTLDMDLQKSALTDDANAYRFADENAVTAVTYDISDRAHPRKASQFSVDGVYESSRISDGYLYLFSWYYGNEVPRFAGELPEVSDVYLTRNLNSYATYTMTSLSLAAPTKPVDEKVIFIDSPDVYVSGDSIVVEYHDYSGSRQRTDLFRFAYAKGKFKPVGVNAVPGSLESSFSIDEDAKGNLRVATTAFGYDRQSSGVYIFNEKMNRIGQLTGLAKGEDIKAARFLDDMLYLVTYENHDPVFSIELSDPTAPQLLGSLEIPGFSDYLHAWDERHLLGIGYDTDPVTGTELGIKLSMFDISDPSEVREESSVVMNTRKTTADNEGYGYDVVPGLSNYRALLIDPAKNLIGFGADSYFDDYSSGAEEQNRAYYLHSYDGTDFVEELGVKNSAGMSAEGVRGVYIGDVFYVVDKVKIRAYDMKKGFGKIGKLKF